MDIAKSRNFLLRENIEGNLYLNLEPKQAISKATNDYNHSLKLGDEEKSNKILNDLKQHLENSKYNWEQDPQAVDILGDLLENQGLNEMAKIQGDLKTAIEKVIADNPELNGLPLKKAIRANAEVLNALDGEDLYDNQLNKFIAAQKGEREVGSRGRKPGGSTDAKQDIDSEISTGAASKLSSIIEPEGEEEEDIIDTWNTPEDEGEVDIEPSARDIKKASAGLGAQDIDIDQANAFKNIITKKVDKIEALDPKERAKSVDMGALKQFISKPEVVKALTVPTIRSLVSSIIG